MFVTLALPAFNISKKFSFQFGILSFGILYFGDAVLAIEVLSSNSSIVLVVVGEEEEEEAYVFFIVLF